ncbi:MAG: hypothetical protein HYX92_18960 [Chloroflexi bacterium]|nr:hypothetical protein [Chloroflexota bacterium]
MGEEEMVTETLTKEMIEAGAALIKKLDEQGVRPDAAFWLYFPDKEQWKLLLADVRLGAEGPRQIYRKIQEILSAFSQEFGELSLDNITLAKPDAPVVALLRTAIRTGSGISGIRFTNNVVDGTLIEDAYIYRLPEAPHKGLALSTKPRT